MASLIKKLIALPKVSKASFLITEAWDLVARQKIDEAEVMFEKAEELFRSLTIDLPCDCKVMKGYIKFKLSKYDESIALLSDAWICVEEDTKLSNADKLHLKEYISSTAMFCEEHLGMEIGCIEHVYPEDVPLHEVSTHLKRNFPSRDHLDWDDYGV